MSTLSELLEREVVQHEGNPGYGIDTAQSAIAQAVAQGLTPVTPAANEAIIDQDTPSLPQDFWERAGMLNRFLPILKIEQTISKGGNLHIYLVFERDLDEIERLFVQCAMGSDWRREVLGFGRHKTYGGPGTMAFETSGAARVELKKEVA